MSKIILPIDSDNTDADAAHVEPMEHISSASSQGGASLGGKRNGSTRNYSGVRDLFNRIRDGAKKGEDRAPATLPEREWETRLKSPGAVCPLGKCSGSGWIEFKHPAEGDKTCVRRCECSQSKAEPVHQSETFRLLVLAGDDE